MRLLLMYMVLFIVLLSGSALALIFILLAKKSTQKPFNFPKKAPQRLVLGWLLILFSLITLSTIYTNKARLLSSFSTITRSDASLAAEVASIGQPKNVRIVGDDHVATVYWDGAGDNSVVGYYVKWGKKSSGTFTDSKQTIHTITQIQPLENGVEYVVQVQSVQGSYSRKPTTSEQGGSDTFAVANGNLSLPVAVSVIPTSARVDSMKSRLTGFFDDMNIPAGGFDETKWNHAVNACVAAGEDGQFINGQFHGHNMTSSGFCDRGGTVSRARGIFDITGKTESDPGVIEFDLDGVTQPRDVWYIDIIPDDARKNGIPVDVTSHNDLFDADNQDPGRMIRIAQLQNGTADVKFHFYGENNQPGSFGSVNMSANMAQKDANYAFMSQVTYPAAKVIANVRRHWRIELSPQKLKIYIDGVKLGEGVPPAFFAGIKKYQIHSTLFSYNTGKQFDTVGPQTSMLHWDNFGFNGPSQSVITHNYLDGGTTGTTALFARGSSAGPIPTGNRSTKIPIPDPIGTPVGQARLMFTLQPFGYSYYSWSASNSVSINGTTLPIPGPSQNEQHWTPGYNGAAADTITPYSTGVLVNPSVLRQGLNDVSFNAGTDVLNVHLEIDYSPGNVPAYTQPKNIFSNFNSLVAPPMKASDMYWFVEQTMGLLALSGGTLPSTPPATAPATIPPATSSFSIQAGGGYTFTKSTLTTGKQMYINEPRFTFFGMPSFLQNIPYVQTSNVDIKADKNLHWSITLNQRSEVYVLYRKIPGAGIPAWLTDGYSRITTDDFSNINQFLLRKNDEGLIGLYDIYKTTPAFNGSPTTVAFGPASDATHTAFSMYLVAVKPL